MCHPHSVFATSRNCRLENENEDLLVLDNIENTPSSPSIFDCSPLPYTLSSELDLAARSSRLSVLIGAACILGDD